MVFEDFVGDTYSATAFSQNASRLINLYPEIAESHGSKNRLSFLNTPGFSRFASLTGYTPPGALYVVPGQSFLPDTDRVFAFTDHLLEVSSTGTLTDRGVINSTAIHPPVAHSLSNGQMVFAGTSGDVRTFNLQTNVLSSTIANVSAEFLTFMDGYFIAAISSINEFQISAIYDGATWDPLDFAVVEATPGNITGLMVVDDALIIFKDDGIVFYQNTGNADFPFEPMPAGVIPVGVVNGSIQRHGSQVFLCGKDALGGVAAYMLSGRSLTRISTHPIETILNQTEPQSHAYAITYSDHGHVFYGVALFPENGQLSDKTAFYDATTGLWHERAILSDVESDDNDLQLAIYSHVYAFGKHLVLHYGVLGALGHVYQLSSDTFTDVFIQELTAAFPALYNNEDGLIKRIRRSPYVFSEKRLVQFHGLELEFDAGTGRGLTSDEPEPVINLRWSDDSAHIWTQNIPRRMGAAGDYRTPIRWFRLGQSRGRIFEINTVAKTHIGITGAYLTPDPEVLKN